MNRTIRSMDTLPAEYLASTLELIERVFTEHADAQEGRVVRRLVEEIRSKKYYLPQLELVMLEDTGAPVGYVMFSRFHLGGKFEDELLLLSPAAVRTDLQRRHISRELIEHGFAKARSMGFKAVLVEGNPQNYRSRGFVTAAEHGILPGKTVHLPHIDCLMAKELAPGAFESIRGTVEYDCYDTLLEE
ncbi:MAG: N-acetyltransferase [Eubacteriales bacterium]|nr:N-acetyltransferase [Eubacteriales bacterium]